MRVGAWFDPFFTHTWLPHEEEVKRGVFGGGVKMEVREKRKEENIKKNYLQK